MVVGADVWRHVRHPSNSVPDGGESCFIVTDRDSRIPRRTTKTSTPTSFSSYPLQPERRDYYAHPCQLISLTSVF